MRPWTEIEKVWPKSKRKKVERNRPSDDPDVWIIRKELKIFSCKCVKHFKRQNDQTTWKVGFQQRNWNSERWTSCDRIRNIIFIHKRKYILQKILNTNWRKTTGIKWLMVTFYILVRKRVKLLRLFFSWRMNHFST